MKYTLKYHKHRLRLLLAKEELCSLCPGRIDFSPIGSAWIGDEVGCIGQTSLPSGPCVVCQGFLEISGICPCNILGPDAIKLTLMKLEEDQDVNE